MKMAFGNGVGFAYDDALPLSDLFGYSYGSFLLELTDDTAAGVLLGCTTPDAAITYRGEALTLRRAPALYEEKLEPIYACNIRQEEKDIRPFLTARRPGRNLTYGRRVRAS